MELTPASSKGRARSKGVNPVTKGGSKDAAKKNRKAEGKGRGSKADPRARDQTPPPTRAKNSKGRAEYERNAFRQFAQALLEGERRAGRKISFRAALEEASLLWNKKATYHRKSSTASFRKPGDDDDEDDEEDDDGEGHGAAGTEDDVFTDDFGFAGAPFGVSGRPGRE